MKRLTLLMCGSALLALVTAHPAVAQQPTEKLDISAFAINMSNIGTGASATVRITIDSWSTPEERKMLIDTMIENGPDALLKKLQQQSEKGRFSIPGLMGPDPLQLRLGHSLRYAWERTQSDGGRRIVILTDRPMSFFEARNRPRTMDYPFTLIEIRTDKDGKGEGKMSVATKIDFDKDDNEIELENYTSEPVRLNNIQVKVKQ